MSKTDLSVELERQLDGIEELLKNDLDNFLEDVLGVEVFMSLPSKELTGFQLEITTGSPNIYLTYKRGKCSLLGYWGFAEDEKNIDTEICETILDYLSQQF